MSVWKNKHVLIATLTAPILGLLSYFAVSTFVGEKPKAAEAGESYMLVEKPNCRRASGRCGMRNAQFELEFSFDRLEGNRLLLKLDSEHTIEGVLLAQQVNETDESQPRPMEPMGPDGLSWSLEISNPDPENQRLHLVASANAAFYVADVSLKFTSESTQ